MNETVIENIQSSATDYSQYLADIQTILLHNSQTLDSIYISLLFIIGVVSAVFVCVLLYKFIKSFY